jgi:hypothetical protein
VTQPQPVQINRATALATLASDVLVRLVGYEADQAIEQEHYPTLSDASYDAVLAVATAAAAKHAPTATECAAAEAFLAAAEPPEAS